jgi:2-polyprenyl-3-methyl-5-hydroxy-6-metoxy-1,4-benzoquinol methylase
MTRKERTPSETVYPYSSSWNKKHCEPLCQKGYPTVVYRSKNDWIIRSIQNKKVLDLGCVGQSLASPDSPMWLHGFLVKHAGSVLGVDLLQKEVDALNKRGFHVVCADVATLRLQETFDVIVAGDLIEHLSNPGQFLDRVVEHLRPRGCLLLTTPNPLTIVRFFQILLTGRMDVNPEHTCWYTQPVIEELARRSGLKIIETAFVDDDFRYQNKFFPGRSFFIWPFLLANYPICRIRPQVSETLCFALQKSNPDG